MKQMVMIGGMIVLMLGTGCGAGPPQYNQEMHQQNLRSDSNTFREQYFGLHPMTGKYMQNNDQTGDYYLGNKTPPFHGDSVKHFNIGHDQDMMRDTVDRSANFQPGAIAVIGDHAWVNVKYTGDEATYKINENDLKARLEFQMPRYKIHLRVTNR